ncbi:hypothetical protein GN956_G1815 [Arapaima gigas]
MFTRFSCEKPNRSGTEANLPGRWSPVQKQTVSLPQRCLALSPFPDRALLMEECLECERIQLWNRAAENI